jgi:hypothetical protein
LWGELKPEEGEFQRVLWEVVYSIYFFEEENESEDESEEEEVAKPAPTDGLQTPSGLETPSGAWHQKPLMLQGLYIRSCSTAIPGGQEAAGCRQDCGGSGQCGGDRWAPGVGCHRCVPGFGFGLGPFESRINFKFLILRDGLGCQAGARALGLVCGTVSSWGADVRPVLDGRIGYPSL